MTLLLFKVDKPFCHSDGVCDRRIPEIPVAPSAGRLTGSPTPLRRCPPSADAIDIAGVDQVRGEPAVEVVLRHEAVDKLFQALGGAACDRGRQIPEPDILVVARVVALVELVPPAEFRADRVPQDFEQLDPLERVVAVRAAQVFIEVRSKLGRLEIDRVRVQIN